MTKKKFGNTKKMIALLLVVVIAVAIIPTQATVVSGAEMSLILRLIPRQRMNIYRLCMGKLNPL